MAYSVEGARQRSQLDLNLEESSLKNQPVVPVASCGIQRVVTVTRLHESQEPTHTSGRANLTIRLCARMSAHEVDAASLTCFAVSDPQNIGSWGGWMQQPPALRMRCEGARPQRNSTVFFSSTDALRASAGPRHTSGARHDHHDAALASFVLFSNRRLRPRSGFGYFSW